MTISFAGVTVNGAHGLASREPRTLIRHSENFWALRGALDIVGGVGARPIIVEVLIHGGYTNVNALESALEFLESRIGVNGTLIVNVPGVAQQEFSGVTFTELERLPMGGRTDTGPVRDVAGTVGGGWCQMAKLHFEQLYALLS